MKESDRTDATPGSAHRPPPRSEAEQASRTNVHQTRQIWRAPSRRAKQIFAAASALVAVLVSLTALFDWVGGKVVDPPTRPPKTIDARIEEAELQVRNERLIDYMRDINLDVSELTPMEEQEKGLRFAVRVRLRGSEGVTIPLLWQMYERTGARLGEPIYQQSPLDFTPENQDHARTVPLWLPYPPKAGQYVVRFSLLDSKRQPLDEATVAFSVRKVPPLQ